MSATGCEAFTETERRSHRALLGLGILAMGAHGHGRRGRPHRHGRGGGAMFPFAQFLAGGPGGFRRGPRARRGDVRTALLLLLAEEPRNGYQLMQELEERSGGVWRPSPGSVYPALAQLEDEGLVRTEEHEGRRTFVLTDAGRAYVDDRPAEAVAPWDELSGAVDDDVAAFGAELRQVATAAVQIGQAGTSGQIAEARKILAEARKALYRLLAEDPAEG